MKTPMLLTRSLRLLTFCAFAIFSVIALTDCKKDKDDDDDDDDTTTLTEPTAGFSFVVDGQKVTFTFTGSDADTYLWDFGDSESSSEANPTHTYASAGTYTVELTVENDDGSDSESKEVTIESTATAEAPQLSLGDADGALYAINSLSVQTVAGFETTIKIGSSVAWFTNGSSLVSVGDVLFGQGSYTGELDINENKSYSWVETETPPTGFANSGGVSFSIAGGNGHSEVNGLSNVFPFPKTKKIAETSDAVSGSASYTLSHDGAISQADSSIFAVHGPEGTVMKRVDGSTSSVTFTSAEMGIVGKGPGILQIASYKLHSQTLPNGKKYYMINEAVANKNVTIE